MDLALAAIEGEQLGSDEVTDFLAVSFSSTDYVGHAFGPNSIELQDTYLRLDLEIERLLNYLDANFGDDYLLFLSADHGVVEVPSFFQDKKLAGGYLDKEEFISSLRSKLNERFGEGELVKELSNHQVFLDHELLKERGLDKSNVRSFVQAAVLEIDEVAHAYTADELNQRNATDMVKKRYENGFNQKLSGDVLVILASGYLFDSGGRVGTTHGSGYTYDTHIPILFYGKSVKAGQSVRQVSITDIAPTLSMLLDVSLPSACTGKPLFELFDEK